MEYLFHYCGEIQLPALRLKMIVFTVGNNLLYISRLFAHCSKVALKYFMSTLERARLSVRQLTHTLRVPPAAPERFVEPRQRWLREVFDQLPNLQSLIVSGVPFLDNRALMTLSSVCDSGFNSDYPLKLLDASYCQNTVKSSLSVALKCLSHLIYLDLSGCRGARDPSVLSRLHSMTNLRILKLQNCGINYPGVRALAAAIGLRVRSLDLTHNDIGEEGAQELIRCCFLHDGSIAPSAADRNHAFLGIEESANLSLEGARRDAEEICDEHLEIRTMQRLTRQAMDQLQSINLPQVGLTHLYICDSGLNVRAVTALIEKARLYVLDAGPWLPPSGLPFAPLGHESLHICDLEQLVTALQKHAGQMRFLRLHHFLVTEELIHTKDRQLEVPRGTDAFREIVLTNVDNEPPTFHELIREIAPAYRPRSESPPAPGSTAGFGRPSSCRSDQGAGINWKEVPATQMAELGRNFGAAGQGLSTTGVDPVANITNGAPRSSAEEQRTVADFLKSLQAERDVYGDARLEDDHSSDRKHGLLPHMIPQLRTLVLTQVPLQEKTQTNSPISTGIINFVKACAQEAAIARLHNATRHRLGYKGHSRRTLNGHLHEPLSSAFALRTLVLEMNSPTDDLLPTSNIAGASTSRTRSSTEDPDSENLWAAAENDFSFYEDEKIRHPYSDRDSLAAKARHEPERTQRRGRDIVAEIAKFRKERRLAHERDQAEGKMFTEGYWDGEVRIVRNG